MFDDFPSMYNLITDNKFLVKQFENIWKSSVS